MPVRSAARLQPRLASTAKLKLTTRGPIFAGRESASFAFRVQYLHLDYIRSTGMGRD